MIIIGNQKFKSLSESSFSKMLVALNQIPSPYIHGFEEDAPEINPRKSLILLQRECAYIDFSNPGNNIRYIGTANLYECVFLMISNGIDYFCSHIDITRTLDLKKGLDKFSDFRHLSVMIVGGYDNHTSTLENLKEIFIKLLEASKIYECCFYIETQHCLDRNNFPDEDEPQFIAEKILEKSNFLSMFLFGKTLDEEKISNLNLRTQDLIEVDLNSKNNTRVQAFISLLTNVRGLTPKTSEKIFNYMLPIALPKINEDNLYRLIKLTYSKTGYQYLLLGYKHHKILPKTSLKNFVLDTKTGEISKIKDHFPINLKYPRIIRTLDTRTKSQSRLVFNGSRSHYLDQPLSTELVRQLNEHKSLIKQKKTFFKKSEIQKIWREFHISGIALEKILKLIVFTGAYEISTRNQKPENYQIYNFRRLESNSFYKPEIVESTITLDTLNKETGLSFNGRLRQHPEYVLDAALEFNSVRAAEELMKQTIEPTGLPACILKFNDSVIYLCVPAINLGKNAQAISEMETSTASLTC